MAKQTNIIIGIIIVALVIIIIIPNFKLGLFTILGQSYTYTKTVSVSEINISYLSNSPFGESAGSRGISQEKKILTVYNNSAHMKLEGITFSTDSGSGQNIGLNALMKIDKKIKLQDMQKIQFDFISSGAMSHSRDCGRIDNYAVLSLSNSNKDIVLHRFDYGTGSTDINGVLSIYKDNDLGIYIININSDKQPINVDYSEQFYLVLSSTAGFDCDPTASISQDFAINNIQFIYNQIIPEENETCIPITCEELEETCGIFEDGCGDDLDCGICPETNETSEIIVTPSGGGGGGGGFFQPAITDEEETTVPVAEKPKVPTSTIIIILVIAGGLIYYFYFRKK